MHNTGERLKQATFQYSLTVAFVMAAIAICDSPSAVWSQELPPAGKPWFVLCISSIEQLHTNLDAALMAADRPELAEVLAAQLAQWRHLAGIDRSRPAGLVRFWPLSPQGMGEEVLFLPTTHPEELLKTMTFGVVEYTRRSEEHYVIARPEIPYHVLIRHQVGWFGDRPATLWACSNEAADWTRLLVQQHDIGALWDLRQIPAAQRQATAETWRTALLPALQRRDHEPDEQYLWRRSWMEPLFELVPLAIQQTRRLLLRAKWDSDAHRLQVDFDLEAEPHSEWLHSLRQWRPRRSSWQKLLDEEEARSAGIVLGLPAVAKTDLRQNFDGQVAWQVFGELLSQRVCVVAWSDQALAPAVSGLESVPSSLVFEQVPVPDVPPWLRKWIGGNTQAWRVQDGRTVWWAFGPPDLAHQRLTAALHAVHDPLAADHPPTLLSARIPCRMCVDAVPWLDSVWVAEQLAEAEDRVILTVSPSSNGLHVRLELPEGVLRVLGGILADELSQQAEWLLFTAPSEKAAP